MDNEHVNDWTMADEELEGQALRDYREAEAEYLTDARQRAPEQLQALRKAVHDFIQKDANLDTSELQTALDNSY